MTVGAGGNQDWTRPDQPLPARPAAAPPAYPEAPAYPEPPADAAPPAPAREDTANWHRFHYPVGVFLAAFGIATLATTALDVAGRRADLGAYVGSGLGLPALVAVKAVQFALVLVAAAALARRRDVWFLPALAAWAAGYGVFAALDVVHGKWLALGLHLVYLAGFAAVLAVSYSLSVKARAAGSSGQQPLPVLPGRTQELALAAMNKWRQQRPEPAPAPAPEDRTMPHPLPSNDPAPTRPQALPPRRSPDETLLDPPEQP
ncbi:hypothetical protein BTM25_30890 [Actinomadura rubteroloni]|uniref:Uncharacterized protein n=1 Tax=Actinomadura rubteroloni TaxID=1926885 RepID=A0A2P4UHE2_9ACTN|nr:hypothetical protein [Actinomadura rubteroloni]POM24460.1 hypothetical protein BTM25_30890 [Actinomadura rubteroloni]